MAYQTPSERKIMSKKSPSIPTRNANATANAGKPTSKSSKSGVPANRNSNTNKSGKVSRKTPKNNPHQIVKSSRSERVNYAQLRSTGK